MNCVSRLQDRRSYGDPVYSKGGNRDLTADYMPIVSTSKSGLLILTNKSAAPLEWNVNDQLDGGELAGGDNVTVYDFRGTVYARGAAVTINFIFLAEWD